MNMEEATRIFHPSVDGKADLYCRPVLKRGDVFGTLPPVAWHFLTPGVLVSPMWNLGWPLKKTQNSSMCLRSGCLIQRNPMSG